MNQTKLTKDEWNAVEIPVTPDELNILKFIQRAFHQPDLIENHTKSLYTYLKLTPSPSLDIHLFHKYFKVSWDVPKTSVKVKKADQIRLDTNATSVPDNLYENVLLYTCSHQEYFHLNWMLKLKVKHVNPYVVQYATHCLQTYTPNISDLVMKSVDLLEKNKYVLYKDTTLYSHQQELFTVAKKEGPKLILYIAPTGTGKTMSPLGLSEQYRVIFVCAAKHVGLALIKACISIGKPCGVAFGCNSTEDIRLHNSAAQKFIRDKKSGAIKKIDNSLGDKVEIIVSDLQSYIYAEDYMLSFFSPDSIVTYWDEPTISMDEEDHELHPIIRRNWTSKRIPNLVLSSATLPDMEYSQFTDATIYKIYSYESVKTIQLISPDNHVVLPHHYCTQEELPICVEHLEQNKILLKYIDLGAVLLFLKHKPLPFTTMDDITINNIKQYYVHCLKTHTIQKEERISTPLTVNMCTEDAWTCAHGPTMFVVDDVTKIVSYYLKVSAIPTDVMNDIMKNLSYNNEIAIQIGRLEKDLKDKNKDEGKEKKMTDNRVSDEVKKIQSEIQRLQSSVCSISLPEKFIPNKHEHLKRFNKLDKLSSAFTSDLEPSVLEKVLTLEMNHAWKVLLMMGIAVFSIDVQPKYVEIVKELTAREKMFAVFATKDFIFGTNYQFAHLYVGKDLTKISQEKLIQTLGRVGRGKHVPYTIRLRDESFIKKLFMPQENIEGKTMERLYKN